MSSKKASLSWQNKPMQALKLLSEGRDDLTGLLLLLPIVLKEARRLISASCLAKDLKAS